jgi:hypothetical protein
MRMTGLNIRKVLSDESGVFLVLAICCMSVFCLFCLSYIWVSNNETGSSTDDRLGAKAFYIAETGANRAVKELWDNKTWQGVTNAKYSGGTFTVKVDSPIGNVVSFVSKATYADVTRAVEVTLKYDQIPAFLHSYFAFTNMHIDNHGVPGMRIKADAWSNGDLDLDAGTRLTGSATCLGYMLIGDRYTECPDSCVVYGDLRCSSLKIEKCGYIYARDSIPEWGLGPSHGDATLMDTYDRHIVNGVWDGTYDLYRQAGSMSISGYLQGEAKTLRGGTPPGESTIVSLEMPIPDTTRLKQIATGPSGLYFASQAAMETYMASHYVNRWDSVAEESVHVYQISGRVIWVNEAIVFGNQPNRVEINGCLVCKGLAVKMRYYHHQVDSLPMTVSFGNVKFDGVGNPSPIPADMYGLLYCTGEVHFHRKNAADRVYLKGAEIADIVHNCLNYTTEYSLDIRKCAWIFGAVDAEPRIVSWRQRKQAT